MITVGETVCPSITSRAGGAIEATSSVPEPEVGQPFTVVGGGAVFDLITAVGSEATDVEPSELVAVTRTRAV